jgi:hypothetical protein
MIYIFFNVWIFFIYECVLIGTKFYFQIILKIYLHTALGHSLKQIYQIPWILYLNS